MQVETKIEGFRELMDQLDELCTAGAQRKILAGALKQSAKIVQKEAERRLGKGRGYVGIGTLRKRHWSASTAAAIGLGPEKKHWQVVFQEYGTSRHQIVAGSRPGSTGRALHFWWGGREFFFKSVDIPAQPPRPFMRPALESKRDEVLDSIKAYLELVLKALGEHKSKTIPEAPGGTI